jgi:hypothetical protein
MTPPLTIAPFGETEQHRLRQIALFIETHCTTLFEAPGWTCIPINDQYILAKNPGIEPRCLILDTNNVDQPAAQIPEQPKSGTFLLSIYQSLGGYILSLRRRERDNNIVFVNGGALLQPESLVYWHQEPVQHQRIPFPKDEVYDKVANLWKQHFVLPFDPFAL